MQQKLNHEENCTVYDFRENGRGRGERERQREACREGPAKQRREVVPIWRNRHVGWGRTCGARLTYQVGFPNAELDTAKWQVTCCWILGPTNDVDTCWHCVFLTFRLKPFSRSTVACKKFHCNCIPDFGNYQWRDDMKVKFEPIPEYRRERNCWEIRRRFQNSEEACLCLCLCLCHFALHNCTYSLFIFSLHYQVLTKLPVFFKTAPD